MTTTAEAHAFPQTMKDRGTEMYHHGLAKREIFAMAALQGLLADHTVDGSCERVTGLAVRAADALIAALNEVKE